jgi:hypothetical protein
MNFSKSKMQMHGTAHGKPYEDTHSKVKGGSHAIQTYNTG